MIKFSSIIIFIIIISKGWKTCLTCIKIKSKWNQLRVFLKWQVPRWEKCLGILTGNICHGLYSHFPPNDSYFGILPNYWRLYAKLVMCLWNTNAPGDTKVKSGKISKSHILTVPHPQGHVMSGKCKPVQPHQLDGSSKLLQLNVLSRSAIVVLSKFLDASLCCLLTFIFWWYRGFCHMTESDLILFLFKDIKMMFLRIQRYGILSSHIDMLYKQQKL